MRPFHRRGGGLGNYLFHLCHCVMYAQIVEGTLLVPTPLSFRTMNRRAVAFDFSSKPSADLAPPIWWDGYPDEPAPRSYDPDKIEIIGSLLWGNELTQQLSFDFRYFCMQEQVSTLFDPEAEHATLGEDTLAIHIRTGDIFAPEQNHKYGQPPLSWYQMLIERCGYRDIVVVTQSYLHHGGPNPVIAEIRRRWPHVKFVSHDTEHDFHTLRHARHLALSSSTFANAAAMLNTGLRTLHIAMWDRAPDFNITEPFPAGVNLGFTRCGYRIKGYESMYSWRGSPDQIDLMLQHSIDDIEVTREF